MKKIVMISLCGVASLFGMKAQDSTKVLLHVPKIQYLGIYVAPEFQYGQIKGKFTSIGGMSAMVLINNSFAIGGQMEHSLDRYLSPSGISPLKLNAGAGGLKLEYIVKPQSVIHCSFNLLIGRGMASADSANHIRDRRDRNEMGMGHGMHNDYYENYGPYYSNGTTLVKYPEHRANYGIIQPGVNIEANLFKYVKFFVGANYRFAIKGNQSDAMLPASTLQGFSATAGLKIGLFDFNTDRFKRAKKE